MFCGLKTVLTVWLSCETELLVVLSCIAAVIMIDILALCPIEILQEIDDDDIHLENELEVLPVRSTADL